MQLIFERTFVLVVLSRGTPLPRRTQAERSDVTTSKLVAAAQELFGQDGYATTSIEAVAAAAGLTKGAAYHHFRNKAALFRSVFVEEQRQISTVLERVAAQESDSWSALLRGSTPTRSAS
jgi:AcrR family transcriptional regulator